MAGLPTVRVDLDDGTGTFPYNISNYVDLAKGVTIKRGRPDQFANVEASELNLTLKNDDGRFTRGNVTYNVFIDQRIKVTETVGATTSVRFTGYVSGWPVAWEGGPAKAAAARIQAFDAFPRLQRKTMGGLLCETVLSLSPESYWPLNEPVTATAAANAAPTATLGPLNASPSSAGGFATAASLGPENLLAAIPATGTSLSSAGTHTGNTGSLIAFVQTTTSGITLIQSGLGIGILVNTTSASGGVSVEGGVTGSVSGSMSAGVWHSVAVTFNGTTLTVYIDGVSAGTSSPTPASLVAAAATVSGTGTGAIAQIATFTSILTAAQVAAFSSAGGVGFAGDTSAARVTRIALYGGIVAADVVTETPVLAALPIQEIADQNPLPALQAAATAEGGLLFIRGDGKLVQQNRYHRAVQVTPDLSITTDDLTTDLQVEYDMDEVTNYATGQRSIVTATTAATEAPTLVSQSAASITTHGQYPQTLDTLLVSTDQEVQDRLDWTVNRYAEPFPRLPDAQIDLLTSTSATQQSALGLELSDRLSIGSLPSQAPTVGDLIVEGWTETIKSGANAEWSLALNTSPFSVVAAFILDDTTYGVLDSTVAPLSF